MPDPQLIPLDRLILAVIGFVIVIVLPLVLAIAWGVSSGRVVR